MPKVKLKNEVWTALMEIRDSPIIALFQVSDLQPQGVRTTIADKSKNHSHFLLGHAINGTAICARKW